jgi:gliding motility-associated-like protein
MLVCMGLQAQKKPCFKVYDVVTKQEVTAFCVGQKIKVVNCEPVGTNVFQYYDFDAQEGGVPFAQSDTVNTHTYNQPKVYRISFLPYDSTSSVSDSTSKAFTVLPLPAPQFQAVGCIQRNVSVTITDQNYNSFQVDFGNGVLRTLPRGGRATHQFAAGQPMRVVVTARYNQAGCTASAETTVQELPNPTAPHLAQIQLLPTGSIGFILDQLRPEYYYLIEKQEGAGFAVADTIKNPATAQVTRDLPLASAGQQGCYRVRVTDICGTNLAIFSNSVCTLPISLTATQDMQLTWPSYPDPGQLRGYQLLKDSQPYRELPKDRNSFKDDQASCHQQHCYELIALLTNNVRSVSNKACALLSNPATPAQPYLSSTFTPENRVRLSLQVAGGQVVGQVTYQKSMDGSGFSDLGMSRNFSLEDNSFKKNQLSCYQALYQDSCSQTSPPSNPTCPILLKAVTSATNVLTLSWTDYVGFPAGSSVRYLLEKTDGNGVVVASIPVTGNTHSENLTADTGQKTFYRIRGMSDNQSVTYSNTESITLEARALIPTAFTPNGDNLNDLFEVKGRYIEVTQLTIYDRWGQVLYQSQGQGWDGRINGKAAPVGTYPYAITWKDENGRVKAKKGIVSLLR